VKKAIACSLILLTLPGQLLAETTFSTFSESFSDFRATNKNACVLQPVTETHTLPKREGDLSDKVGTIVLVLQLAVDGTVGAFRISQSSNNEALDALTTDWIRKMWRWKTAGEDCQSTNVDLTVYWKQSDEIPNQPKSGCALEAIVRTHTIPSERSDNGRAAVFVGLSVGVDGRPSDLTVLRSSGNAERDIVAMGWIEQNWRWEPRPAECGPSPNRINMRW